MPVHDIRIAARKTQGVTLFRMGEDEQVVSATRLDDAEMDEDEIAFDGEGDEAAIPGDTVQQADDVPNGESD